MSADRRGQHNGESPVVLEVGLFTRPSQPEGEGYVEYPKIDGYEQKPAKFIKTGAQRREFVMRNEGVLLFPNIGPGSPQPTHVSLFDAGGKVVAYGMFDGIGGRKPEGELEFRPCSILLQWTRTPSVRNKIEPVPLSRRDRSPSSDAFDFPTEKDAANSGRGPISSVFARQTRFQQVFITRQPMADMHRYDNPNGAAKGCGLAPSPPPNPLSEMVRNLRWQPG